MKFDNQALIKQAKIHTLSNISKIFELPPEILLNLPKITLMGNENLIIENYIGITGYNKCEVSVNTNTGLLKIYGNNFEIEEISNDLVQIYGSFKRLEYQSNG
jgi:sporulation protein YqfC